MSDEKNIKTFTAADIEKYWTGKLSGEEMHALEKAAMDDPFLADALEGYQNTTTVAADLNTLRERLDKRAIALAPIFTLKQKKFPWFRVAAAIIIIAGLGLLVQQLVFDNKQNSPIVNVDKNEKQKDEVAATENQIKPDTPKTSLSKLSDTLTFKFNETNSSKEKTLVGTFALSAKDSAKVDADRLAGDIKTENSKIELQTNSAAAIAGAEKKAELEKDKEAFRRSNLDTTKYLNDYNASTAKAKANEKPDFADKTFAGLLNNKYNYRVVDAQNNPVPFANVMNTRDNVGTYTDIRGNFNLVSSDSVLDVQIRSLGYLSDNYKLVPSTQSPSLVLKEDNNARNRFLAPNQQVVSNVTRKDTTELEEPEVGWGNYNTYVANNIQIPEIIRGKTAPRNVELSFDIDKAGNPINIKVTKSSQCKECDEEAKRLLKEGPKWKRKGKKSKTTISIAVDQK